MTMVSPKAAAWHESGNLRGALWVTLSAVGFTLTWSFAKLLTEAGIPPMQIAFARALIALMAIMPFVIKVGPRAFKTKHPLTHAVRAISGAAAMVLGFYAITALPLAELMALSFTTPLFALLLAALIVGEKVGWRRSSAAGVGFLGMLIMLQPGSAAFQPMAFAAVAAAALIALCVILLKRFPKSENQVVMLFYFCLTSTLVAAVPAILVWQPLSVEQWLLLAGVALAGLTTQNLLISGFRAGEASFVAPFDYSKLLFASLAGYLVFGEIPGPWTLVGAVVIVAATFYIAQREAQLRRRG